MALTAADFRKICPVLEHYSPSGLHLELGLMTAYQVLDVCADVSGTVLTRFIDEEEFRPYPKDYWATRSRFKRGAGERGSNLFVRDAVDITRQYVLGNNYPLG